MERQRKRWLSNKEKDQIWQRWRQGESLSEIGRGLERNASGIFHVVAKNGGIAPLRRKRSALALTAAEREEISRGLKGDESIRQIAAGLGRAPSTISREINRNGGAQKYRAGVAEANAWTRALRPKTCALASNARLCRLVASKLKLEWAPAQIAGWLKRAFPVNKRMQISHETIYRSMFIQTRGVLKKELISHLRTHRTMRRSENASRKGQNRGAIVDAVSISERPAEAQDRAVPGHWEGDLITGSNNTHIATLVERHTLAT
jgi:IS30 family transposase